MSSSRARGLRRRRSALDCSAIEKEEEEEDDDDDDSWCSDCLKRPDHV